VKTENWRVNCDMFELQEAFQATEHIQHCELDWFCLRYGDYNDLHFGHGR
jgi:hypothetical protein